MIPEASALTVDTSCIDCSEVESQEDRDFLMEKGENILRIVSRAALEVGEHIVCVQEHFSGVKNGSLTKFYKSIGIENGKANKWAHKYRAYRAYLELFGNEGAVEKLEGIADETAQRLWNLPAEYREAFLKDISVGKLPTIADVKEVSSKTEVKLLRAEELLAEANGKKQQADKAWSDAKNDIAIQKGSPEYHKADDATRIAQKSIDIYKQQVEDLKAQIEVEKMNADKEIQAREKADKASAKAIDKLQSEVDRLNTPAEAQKQRMLATSNALYAQLPNVHGHLVTFYGDIEAYDSDTIMRIEEQIKLLQSLIEAHL